MTDRSSHDRGAAMPPEPPPLPAARSGRPEAPDPLVGRVINGRFKIVALVARGGMGKVYRAEQAPLGRVCAVKVLNPSYAGDQDPEFHKRFFLEASTAAKLTHPNTVTIFDYGRTEDDVYYMAMEYLEGLTLHRAIKMAGALPEDRTIRIMAQICRALREAHGLGVVHRDLKPANIFLVEHGDEEDFVKILDFGLVKNLDPKAGDDQLTQTGLFIGSPKYMAPEQIRGENVDARTDVYSLGVMLYEMLTGRVPFERTTSVNTLMAHVSDPPPPLHDANPTVVVSPGMTEIVMRCLEKEADLRYASMDEVLAALKRVAGVPASMFPGATGAYNAILQSGSGAFPAAPPTPTPLRSVPPAPLPTHPPGGDLTPRGAGRVVAFALVAVAAISAIAVAAFFARSPRSATAGSNPGAASGEVASTVAPDPAVDPAASAGPSAAPVAELPATVALRIESEPAGASVHEDGREVCSTTPCSVVYRGPQASADVAHHVVVTKVGYRTETRTLRAGDGPLDVKLARLATAPARGGDKADKTDKGDKTPDGFKDMPY